MRRIRVVQLVAGIAIGDQSGGAEQIGIHLARYLDQETFESVVFAMRGYGSATEKQWLAKLTSGGIPVYGLTTSKGFSLQDLNRSLRDLWSFVDAFRPDIINSHSERGDALNALLRLLHPVHPRAVRTMHTDQQWQTRPITGTILTQGLFPLVFDAEIAVSLAVRAALEQRLVARVRHRKAALCYEGIDGSHFDHTSETTEKTAIAKNLPPDRPRIGIVGRLAEQKGHTYILQAMPLIRHTIPAHLVVIGAGALEAALHAETQRLGIQDVVHFLGSRDDVLEIMPNLDLIVSASLWEGLPAAILEAMSMGVPVVATDVSGSREVIQTGLTGILVPAADPAALAQAAIALLTDHAGAYRMAQNARQMAAQFTVQNAAPCYGQIYEELVAARH
jgi:glycosyltransferase involved in cell wall biosynthesis